MAKKKILFLCTGNSCRSQMAEGWTRHLWPDTIEPLSAGIESHGMDTRAIEVMKEAGVNIQSQKPKLLDNFDLTELDCIITVCDHAHESCPVVPAGCSAMHKNFDDPPKLAEKMVEEEEILDCYRRTRDEIKSYVTTLPEKLADKGGL